MRDLSTLDRDHVNVLEIGEDGGAFLVRSPTDNMALRVIASYGNSWDHASVSRSDRIPDWDEMSRVHRLFFQDNETAVQFHVPPSDHINCHPYTLHLWRHQRVKYLLPPKGLV